MRATKVTTLKQFVENVNHAQQIGTGVSSLQEVLAILMKMNISDEESMEIRYFSKHLIPCAIKKDQNCVAVLYYNYICNPAKTTSSNGIVKNKKDRREILKDKDFFRELDSFVIDLMEIGKIDWSLAKEEGYLLWVK